MSEMIDRGAAAILAKVPLGYGMTKAEAAEYTRAVIESLREPTAAMLAADEVHPSCHMCGGHLDGWRLMIDEALK